jgi:predicted nucleic acid-binding protein
MIVVADSSPLIVLATIGHQDVLCTLFQQVVVPPEVASELASPKRAEVVREFITGPPDWLSVRSPSFLEPIPALHSGENAAIALAREIGASWIIIDERLGRHEATVRGLSVIGTIGVLEAAAERGLVDLEEAFQKVRKTDFWISPRFLEERLARFRERQS